MRQWRNGAGNAPRHYAGTRSASGCALSRTRSLTAAAIAVAMMATVAVTSLLPTYNAKADTSAEPGICTPQSISLGDDGSASTVDSGVATYVGGNMYVGANNQNNGGTYADLSSAQKIDKSYAVEAEGLTLVNGKLATNGAKTSWNSKGFRFGVVGFGAQFRPKSGSDVLVVAGNNTSNTGNSTGKMWDADEPSKSVSALGGFDNGSTGRAFVQNEGTDSDPTWYSARINGDTSWHFNADKNSSGLNAGRSVWDATASSDADGNAYTNVKFGSAGLGGVFLNGATKNYSTFYADNVLGLSMQLAGLQKSEGVHVADAVVSTAAADSAYVRHHYGYDSAATGKNKISYTFKFSGVENANNAEKLITFEGDADASGKGSAMQVFNVTASQLSSTGYRGVDFAFTDIPNDASVVVNVSGTNIDFHNGWRFWWNGTEIGDGYSKAAEDNQKNLYSAAAQKIMWNFKEATQVTIHGGVANESTGELDGNEKAKSTNDDPAAAMLGSILIPNGNFEDHVTTNGRVYVGGDFSMYNPTAIPYVNPGSNSNGWEGATASVINMDQERHNLPWNGTLNSSCAVIQINKVDSSKNKLAGTTWGVFKNYADAKAGANALRVVKDGGAFDLDNVDNGTIQIGSLNPEATYYVKEITSANGYQVSDKVYRITAGAGGSTVQNVQESADGTTWTDVEGNQIINVKKGASLEWSKVDGSDSTSKVLSGSEWQLTTSDGQTAYQITDSTKSVESVKIYYNGADSPESIMMKDGIPFDLTASVFGTDNKTDGVPQGVAWTATGSVVVDDNGKVTAVNDAEGSGTSAAPIVYSCGDAKGKCDMDTKAGYFKVVDLADGTYTLTETVAPNGYSIAGPYTVTITTTNGVTSVSITNATGGSIANNKIPNIRNTGTISWNKVSSDSNNDKKLSGSEWKLTKTKNFGWNATTGKAEYADIASDQQKPIAITDCVPAENKTAAETTCSAPAGAAEDQPYDVDPAAGQFKLEGLDWGRYTLVETKAPDGYDVDSTVRTFTFGPVAGSDGTGKWNSNSVAAATGNTTGAFTTSDKDYDSSVFTFTVGNIKNKPGVILPGTGGAGDYWIYAAALVAALIGVVAAGMALKVRRRQ